MVDVVRICDQFRDEAGVPDIALDELVAAVAGRCGLACSIDVVAFDVQIVERIEVVQNDHIVSVGDEPLGEVPADEARATGDEYVHTCRWVWGRAKRRRVSTECESYPTPKREAFGSTENLTEPQRPVNSSLTDILLNTSVKLEYIREASLRVIDCLRDRSYTVGELANVIDKSQSWTSEVVNHLADAHLVERDGEIGLADTYEATLLAELHERYALDKVLTGTKEDILIALLSEPKTIENLREELDFPDYQIYNKLRQLEADGQITVDRSGRLNTYQRVG